jgi:hypothetical protein
LGRPKGSTNKSKDESKDIDIEKLVSDAIDKALKDKEKEHDKEIKKLKEQIKNSNSNLDDIRVEVMNNTFSIFIMSGRKGKSANIFYKLESHGDTAILDYEEFRNYYAQNSKHFKSGELLITDVIGGAEVKDVLEKVKLDYLYEGKLSLEKYDEILNADYKDFEDFIKEYPQTFDNLLEHAVQLHKKAKFNYGDKQNYFRQAIKNPELFK